MNSIAKYFILGVFLTSLSLQAQLGGKSNFNFLNLSIASRQEALGGSMVPFYDSDPDMVYQNPAIIDSSMGGYLSSSIQLFPADIQFGLFTYIPKKQGAIRYALGTNYVNYGSMSIVDENGEKQGSFYSGEMATFISLAKEIEGFDVGGNIKVINSFIESYYALAIALDVQANYQLDSNRVNVSMAVRNLGLSLMKYTDSEMKMPLDVQIGIARELEHMPLQVFATYHHLNQFDLVYDDPVNANQVIVVTDTQSVTQESSQLLDKFGRHLVIGGEFNFADKFYFRLAYNYLRRQELKLTSRLSSVGISWGLGLKFRKWNIAYSRSKYHLAFSPNNFSISIRI